MGYLCLLYFRSKGGRMMPGGRVHTTFRSPGTYKPRPRLFLQDLQAKKGINQQTERRKKKKETLNFTFVHVLTSFCDTDPPPSTPSPLWTGIRGVSLERLLGSQISSTGFSCEWLSPTRVNATDPPSLGLARHSWEWTRIRTNPGCEQGT